ICPVFDLHKIYSSEETRTWAANGCRTAGIGCLECKKPLIEQVVEEISGIRKRAQEFEENPELVRNIVAEGSEKAREAARATLDDVRRVMNLRVDGGRGASLYRFHGRDRGANRPRREARREVCWMQMSDERQSIGPILRKIWAPGPAGWRACRRAAALLASPIESMGHRLAPCRAPSCAQRAS